MYLWRRALRCHGSAARRRASSLCVRLRTHHLAASARLPVSALLLRLDRSQIVSRVHTVKHFSLFFFGKKGNISPKKRRNPTGPVDDVRAFAFGAAELRNFRHLCAAAAAATSESREAFQLGIAWGFALLPCAAKILAGGGTAWPCLVIDCFVELILVHQCMLIWISNKRR